MDKPVDIYSEILNELEYQRKKWGEAFDNKNTLNDWVTYICQYATNASCIANKGDEEAQEKALIKTAALCFSALMQKARTGWAPRHYD